MDPVLYRTALLDPNTGSMSREWIRYFNQLGAGGDTSMFFKQPNYIKFNNTAADPNDGRIGNSLFAPGLNLVGINNDGTARKIQIWGGVTQNENTLGNTWAGKNTYSDPANIVFGPNYQNWTPLVLGVGGMFVFSVTIQEAKYLRVGPLVHFTLTVWFSLAGSAGNTITVSVPPVSPVFNNGSSLTMLSTGLFLPGSPAGEVGFGYVSGPLFTVTRSGGANFPVTSGIQLFMSGVYRCS